MTTSGPHARLPKNALYAQVRVERAKVGQPLTIAPRGPWRGLYAHYNGKRSVPCFGNDCPNHTKEPIWYGFMPVVLISQDALGMRQAIAELTEHAAAKLVGVQLRGIVLKLFRAKLNKESAVDVDFLPETVREASLPPSFDVAPILSRLYRSDRPLPLDAQAPPFPMLPRVKGIIVETYSSPIPEERDTPKPLSNDEFVRLFRGKKDGTGGK